MTQVTADVFNFFFSFPILAIDELDNAIPEAVVALDESTLLE
jgi:hypothetical protein